MNQFSKLRHDKRAVVWVWAVVFMGLFIYSLVWFTTGWAVMEVSAAVEDEYAFEGPAADASSFIKLMFEYNPILFFFGLLLWAYVNSQRRDPRFE